MMCTLPCKLKLTRKQIGYEWELENETRPSALGMSDPGVTPLEILEILELEIPPHPRPPCRCPPCRLVR